MSFQSREDMRQGATPVVSPLVNIQQRWEGLEGYGPQQMKLESGAFAEALGLAMDAFAARISERYGVDIQQLSWTRHQGDGPNAAR